MVRTQQQSVKHSRKKSIKLAKAQQNYLDFWSRLSLDKVRNQLLKSNNMVPTPVLDNQNYPEGTDKYGHTNSGKDIAPVRELYGPTGRYHATDWRMGAVARVTVTLIKMIQYSSWLLV